MASLSVRDSSDGLRREVHSGGALPTVWFEISPIGETPPPPLSSCDFAVLAMLPAAMQAGEPIVADFNVDARLLEGLEHFQEVWHSWRPDVFRKIVPIEVAGETLRGASPDARPAAAAVFSSGVDSTATLLRHAHFGIGRATRALRTAVMAHGFDMPLEAEGGFQQLCKHARRTTDALGLDFVTIKTNWRATLDDWEMSFGVGLAVLLHLLSADHSFGLIATEESYFNSFTVWGSSFWNDRFFTSSRMRIESDAGEIDRIDRAALIGRFPSLVPNLHVCWAGPRVGENCGICAKCILTKLAFVAASVPEPWPFKVPLTLVQVRSFEIVTDWQLRFLRILHRRLRTTGATDLTSAVAARLARADGRDRFSGLRRLVNRRAE